MEETRRARDVILEVLYIVILAAAAMGDFPALGLSNDMTRAFKALSLIIVAMGAVVLFVSGRLERVRQSADFVGVYAFILVGIIVWSIFLWIINLETIIFIMRGTMKFMFQFIVLIIIFSATYMFGERAIYTTFYGLALANTVMLVTSLGIYGPSESINSVITMISGGIQDGFAKGMEIHDITFSYGFFIIYFLFFAQHNKERTLCLIVSLFYFVLGWKRIAFLALPISIFFAILLGRMNPRRRQSFMRFTAWLIIVASFLYILITRYGIFEKILEYFNMDSMGRNEVYDYIKDYYTIGIGFIGYGFEYTTVILQHIMNDLPSANIGVLALHNNILTVYIELGFLGFWAWLTYTWVFQFNWMLNNWDEKTSMLFFLCEIYIFTTYTTDNTLYYFFTSLTLRLMPMAYSFHVPTAQDISLWPWVKERKKV